MRVWRLARRAFAALDGAGASRYGGRWNRTGQDVVYTAENLSLAVLEVVVHLELAMEFFPPDYVKIAIDVPEIELERAATLPRSAGAMLELGARWYQTGRTAALLVPSVIVHEEHNLLLNPHHPDFARLRSRRPQSFKFDALLACN